jgi:hypothetical protein
MAIAVNHLNQTNDLDGMGQGKIARSKQKGDALRAESTVAGCLVKKISRNGASPEAAKSAVEPFLPLCS